MCVSAPKIKPPAPAAAPASEGADALVLGTAGNNTNEEELRQRGIQGRSRLFIGRGGARTRGTGSASSGGGSGSGGSSGGSSLAIGGGYASGGGGGDAGGGGLTIGSGRGGYGLGGAIS